MIDSGNVGCLINPTTADILTTKLSSSRAAMRERADSVNVACFPRVDTAEDLTITSSSSLSAVIRNWMAASDNAERIVRVFTRVDFHDRTELNVSIRVVSENEL